MNVDTFSQGDIPVFLRLAAAEQWVAEPWEFSFLLESFPQGCFCTRDEAGQAVAFVTALLHNRSGWIGNLIVAGEHRGKGVGQRLFLRALAALQESGAETVWLTASRLGKSLYEQQGFSSVDTIIRWNGSGRGAEQFAPAGILPTDICVDMIGWGDRRARLLDVVCRRGTLLEDDAAMAVIQPCGGACQLGPWGAVELSQAARLLDRAMTAIPADSRIYVDAPACNRQAVTLLQERGFISQGTNELMYAGLKPAYHPEYIYGLASMGSCG